MKEAFLSPLRCHATSQSTRCDIASSLNPREQTVEVCHDHGRWRHDGKLRRRTRHRADTDLVSRDQVCPSQSCNQNNLLGDESRIPLAQPVCDHISRIPIQPLRLLKQMSPQKELRGRVRRSRENPFRSRTPRARVRVRSIWSARRPLKTTTSCLARVMATFNRRSPPSRFSGPKFIETRPVSSRPKQIEKKITSRSSPCTFSKFFTKTGSPSTGDSSPK